MFCGKYADYLEINIYAPHFGFYLKHNRVFFYVSLYLSEKCFLDLQHPHQH